MSVHHHWSPAEIVALNQQIVPNTYRMNSDICMIGRSPLCRVVVPYRTVSRLHAKIECNGTECMLTDVGSANGTFVNGCRVVEPYRLKDHDLIGLGTANALFQFSAPGVETEAR
jgi:pSer/pThr/pTyr-binding forkhead associated (FHA) protein